jgi:hypothetical protein
MTGATNQISVGDGIPTLFKPFPLEAILQAIKEALRRGASGAARETAESVQ